MNPIAILFVGIILDDNNDTVSYDEEIENKERND